MPEHENPTPETNTSETAARSPFETFVYHQRRALEETAKALEALLPEGFREHGQVAGKEFVKGFKVLVDAALDEIEKTANNVQEAAAKAKTENGGDAPPSSTGKAKVRIEVE